MKLKTTANPVSSLQNFLFCDFCFLFILLSSSPRFCLTLNVILIFSKDGKDYQLSPPRDVCVFEWLMNLKVRKTQLHKKNSSDFIETSFVAI